ncbi:protein kinase [Streptomyces sp. NPDC016459]|uniref:protein kinase domain-containing protein n=1 Tax=Streptomyces sp. NPDC016459 TaxID=3157190 RepID=UPI0033C4F6B0
MTVIAGRYRLLDVLAERASGTVWRALDEKERHEVALKESRAPAGLGADEVPLLHARREREARAAARISHPAVVRVLGVVTEDGRPWVVTEIVRGLTLAETLEAAGPLPPREAARVGAEVLSALRAAREAGAPHRGVEPRHVLLANDGRVLVTGFGAAPGDDPGQEAELRSLGALLHAAASALPSADDPTGALRTLIEGLCHPDPAHPLTVTRAEEELRRSAASGRRLPPAGLSVPAGGEPGGGGGEGRVRGKDEEGGDGRSRAGRSASPPRGTHLPHRTATPSGVRPPQPTAATRRRHVILAGAVGALLIAGALTYHAVRDDGGGTGPGPGGVTSTAPTGPGATDGAVGGRVTPRS